MFGTQKRFMRAHWILVCLVSLGLTMGCQQKDTPLTLAAPRNSPDPIASWHFLGSSQMAADTNLTKLKALWDLPASRELKTEAMLKLAKVPFALARTKAAPGTNDFAPLLQPLIEDLVRSESFFQMRGLTNQPPELLLAVRLDETRAQIWRTNLAAVLGAWMALPTSEIQAEGLNGWELKKHVAPNLVRFVRAGDWVVLGWGQDRLSLQDETLMRIKKENRPVAAAKDYWLSAWADWPRLAPLVSLSNELDLSQIRFTLVRKDESVRMKLVLESSTPLSLKLDPWQIPTNTIHGPFVSFTAVRGIGEWLSRQKAVQPFKWGPMPNQFCIWAMPQIPFQTFVAAPVANPTNVLQELSSKLGSAFNANIEKYRLGSIQWQTNGIVWEGLPYIVPSLRPVHGASGDFILGGIFPNTPTGAQPPAELLSLLNRGTNLVYYDWEITPERLTEWRNVSQLFLVLSRHRQLDAQSAGAKWLDAVGSKLGVTLTEGAQTGPKELTFMRGSPLGFTAVELVTLANWLQSTNFPFGVFDKLPVRTNLNFRAVPPHS